MESKQREASNLQSFYAHGKLLITSEYLVLDGAEALALPTIYGQSLEVETIEEPGGKVHWESLNPDGSAWYSGEFDLNDLPEQDKSVDGRLSSLFSLILEHSSAFELNKSYRFKSKLEFDREFGLGSSSTLLYNLSQFADLNPFALSDASFGGSGYDIACAGANGPIIYRNKKGSRTIKPTEYNPSFKDQIYFAYSGQKQDSREGIKRYREHNSSSIKKACELATGITKEVLKTEDLETFEDLLFEHEKLISDIIGMPTRLESEFSDFPGLVKSLGAWGGDFLLFTFADGKEALEKYLNPKGIGPVFSYDELILEAVYE